MRFFLLNIALLLTGITTLKSQSVDEILQKHFELRGQSKLSTVNTIVTEGTASQMGMDFPFTLYQKRPGKVFNHIKGPDFEIKQCLANGSSWTVNPMSGSTEAMPMTGYELDQMKEQAEIDGPLFNYKTKNITIKLIDPEKPEWYTMHATIGKRVVVFSFHRETYDVVQIKFEAEILGQYYKIRQELRNYKVIEGVRFPTTLVTFANGNESLKVVMKTIRMNVPVSDSMFAQPK